MKPKGYMYPWYSYTYMYVFIHIYIGIYTVDSQELEFGPGTI